MTKLDAEERYVELEKTPETQFQEPERLMDVIRDVLKGVRV